MPRFAANLSWLFTELPFRERFTAAADAGFRAVEFLFPYEWPANQVADWARVAGVEIVLFNLPTGDWAAGDRGLAALPGREAEFRASLDLALAYAQVLGVPRLHAMAGIAAGPAATEVISSNLRRAADRCAASGRELLIEPLNPRDAPGYFLRSFEQARAIVAELALPNLRIQADLYHMQIVGGDLTTRLSAGIADIGHVQTAGVPLRHEPDSGELDCHRLFDLLDGLGYMGWVGAEYRPAASTRAGLGWLDRYR